MGFLSSATTIELTAKLTPSGRRKLITGNNTLIQTFSLGDSDSYYGVYTGLTNGQVPGIGGDNAGADINNGGVDYLMRSVLFQDSTTDKKPVEPASITVSTTFDNLGFKTITGSSITHNTVALADISSDSLTNLFYSFALPITASQFNNYTGLTDDLGGYANTAFSGLAQNKILVIGVDNNDYAELIDGKTIKLDVTTTASTYSIYGTYENTGRNTSLLDSDVIDTSNRLNIYGPNRALLFSDGIKTPNGGNPSKSWATGYATTKPFSLYGKETYNFKDNSGLSLTADTPVGIAYLDKGFIVITDPTIVNDFVVGGTGSTATTLTYNHVRSTVSQSITCVAERGEFGVSSNATWASGDTPRITEIGLFDGSGDLIAIAKLNSSYEKVVDDMVAFNVTINY
jgi:hypothetical protein